MADRRIAPTLSTESRCPDCGRPLHLETHPFTLSCARCRAVWEQMVCIDVNERMLSEHKDRLAVLLAPRLRALDGGRP